MTEYDEFAGDDDGHGECRRAHDQLQADLDAERAKVAAIQKLLAEEEEAHEETIRHRDFCERWADKLASGVGDIEVIGEHSNLNNPWETAYGLMRPLAEFKALEAQVEALRRFKSWTHAYLDTHGVPHHPPGPHGAEGCRIGDRMDWLMAKLKRIEDAADVVCDQAVIRGAVSMESVRLLAAALEA